MPSEKQGSTMCSERGDRSEVKCCGLRQQLRPCALVLLFLSATVTLWGFGYRISRYNPHPDITARAISAKMWDKHQDVDQIAGSLKVSGQTELHAELHAAVAILQRVVQPEFAFVRQDERARVPVVVRSAVPLRSPPFHLFVA